MKTRMIVLVALFAILMSGCGGDTSVTQTNNNGGTDTGIISGVITDKTSGAEIGSALVLIDDQEVTADASGKYQISNLAPGSKTVNVVRSGYYKSSTTVALEKGKTVTASVALKSAVTQEQQGTCTIEGSISF